MFRSKTVFVVGAGASAEVKLPIGKELTAKISALLNIHSDVGRLTSGDPQIYETLKRLVILQRDEWQGNTLLASARHIGEAMELATSIDTFLESFAHDRERVLLGKLGIAKAILDSERGSLLAPSGAKPFSIRSVADTWYVSLAQLLFAGVSAQEVSEAFADVSFIVFNYDRCLQTFLLRALQIYFQMPEGEAVQILQKVKFLHPYGTLGSVFGGQRNYLGFGSTEVDLHEVATRVDTFSETVRDVQLLEAIRQEIREAETLVFLGFGFHEQNIRVLCDPRESPPQRNNGEARVIATTHKLSGPDTNIVRALISNMVWGQPPSGYIEASIHTFNGTCAELFSEYWRSLTAEVRPAS